MLSMLLFVANVFSLPLGTVNMNCCGRATLNIYTEFCNQFLLDRLGSVNNCENDSTYILYIFRTIIWNFIYMHFVAEKGNTIPEYDSFNHFFLFSFDNKGSKLYMYFINVASASLYMHTNTYAYICQFSQLSG